MKIAIVGKRVAMWASDLLEDLEEIRRRRERLRFLGAKGATGTQASFLELLGGDHARVRELERRVARKLGFAEQFSCGFQIPGVHEDLAPARGCEVLHRRVDRIGVAVPVENARARILVGHRDPD